MSTIKRVFSEWPGVVGPLSLLKGRPRLLHRDRLTASIMRSFGSKLVVLDETTKRVEHRGVAVTDKFMELCGARGEALIEVTVDETVPAAPEVSNAVDASTAEAPALAAPAPVQIPESLPITDEAVPDKPKRGRKSKPDSQ